MAGDDGSAACGKSWAPCHGQSWLRAAAADCGESATMAGHGVAYTCPPDHAGSGEAGETGSHAVLLCFGARVEMDGLRDDGSRITCIARARIIPGFTTSRHFSISEVLDQTISSRMLRGALSSSTSTWKAIGPHGCLSTPMGGLLRMLVPSSSACSARTTHATTVCCALMGAIDRIPTRRCICASHKRKRIAVRLSTLIYRSGTN